MPDETYSASLVSRFSLPGTQRSPERGYYRSKLFINSSTTNPLVAAAGPLLSLLERLSVSPTLPPIHAIRDNIEHELNAFQSRLAGLEYAEEFSVIASYLLSATIDELLGKNYLRLHGKPAEFKAFTPLSHNEVGPERRFFDIIYHIKERTNQYLDLLELGYYCLIAGFEGEQHLKSDGRQALDNLIEELYQLIQHNRANKPHRLFREKTNTLPEVTHHKPIFIAALSTLATLVAIYFASHSLLEHKAKKVLLRTSILANVDN
jgi:type VI secretion system protein ImpK